MHRSVESVGIELRSLNKYINSLSAEMWGNGYADSKQREYDLLLKEYNSLLSEDRADDLLLKEYNSLLSEKVV